MAAVAFLKQLFREKQSLSGCARVRRGRAGPDPGPFGAGPDPGSAGREGQGRIPVPDSAGGAQPGPPPEAEPGRAGPGAAVAGEARSGNHFGARGRSAGAHGGAGPARGGDSGARRGARACSAAARPAPRARLCCADTP